LVFNKDTFEPLTFLDNSVVLYDCPIIKKLVTVDKHFINLMNINIKDSSALIFNLKLDNLEKYVKEPTTIQEKTPSDNTEEVENGYGEILPDESDANVYVKDIEDETVVEPELNSTQLVFKISPKMKLEELKEIAKKLNIETEKTAKTATKKNVKKCAKTKTELIEEINKILKK
jgi:hypothetical protein